jgi:AGZA family xanthine/uracil permease-like MFS transporter
MDNFSTKLDNFFEIKARGSTIKTEIIAGLTTFFAMCYIVIVNPNQMSGFGLAGQSVWNAVFIGSILAAVIGTLLTGIFAKMPFAQAAGMGLNSFFATCFLYGIIGTLDTVKSYQAGLVIIFLSGLIFLGLSVTGLRSKIAKALPDCLKKAIPAGIGLFIALIGFNNAGIVVADRYTMVSLVDFTSWANAAPAIAALAGLLVITILTKYKVKGNIILGILASSVLYYLLTWTAPAWDWGTIGQSFKDFGSTGITSIFKGESWSLAFSTELTGGFFGALTLIITFCLVDMFDTVGTLYGTAAQAGMLDENGDPINVDKCMMADSIATVAGAVLGTSTVTTYVESAAGVAEGGRTGLSSIVVAACFLICLFLTPLASIIPTVATAPALIFVGVLMLRNFKEVDLTDATKAIPAFLALILMPLTYSIANGIGIGAIAYVIINLITSIISTIKKDTTEIGIVEFLKKNVIVIIIAVLFAIRFALIFTGTYPVYVF